MGAEHNQLKLQVLALQKDKLRLETILSKHSLNCNLLNKTVAPRQVADNCQEEELDRGNSCSLNLDESRKEISSKSQTCGNVCGNVCQGHLRNLTKDQKIAILKTYLKENQSKPEVQKLLRKITEMTKPSYSDEV